MKLKMKYLLFFMTTVLLFSTSTINYSTAEEEIVEDTDIRHIKKMAQRVIEEFDRPYRVVALGVSAAVLPDEVDYLFHKPLDIDVSFPLDTFKRHYCSAIPADSSVEIVEIGGVKISEWKRVYDRSGVYIDYPKLKEAVEGTVVDFRESEGKDCYDFTVKFTRSASVRVRVKLKMQDGTERPSTACNPDAESRFYISFVEHQGKWRLYDISRGDLPECRTNLDMQDPPGLEPTPFYSDCTMPAE